MKMLDDLRHVRGVTLLLALVKLTARYLESSSIFMVNGRFRLGRVDDACGVELRTESVTLPVKDCLPDAIWGLSPSCELDLESGAELELDLKNILAITERLRLGRVSVIR
jgi:hypothetical protein